ncbi:MAG: hypothetical protein WC796_03495 [Candidatus Pacearchaeota archaeon]|jgi:hypothetical protein
MRDRKFAIALLIIVVLAIGLVYVLAIKPKFQGYVVNQQVEAQKALIKSMIQVANQQGYLTLNDGTETVILVKYQQQAQQPNQAASQQAQTQQTQQPTQISADQLPAATK